MAAECCLRHHQAREPQPIRADLAIEAPIGVDTGVVPTLQTRSGRAMGFAACGFGRAVIQDR